MQQAKYRIVMRQVVFDPEERQRRLAQAFDLLLSGFGYEKITPSPVEFGDLAEDEAKSIDTQCADETHAKGILAQ